MTTLGNPNSNSSDSLGWRKSSYSSVDDCVEVARLNRDEIAVRNSRCPDEGIITIPSAVFMHWVHRMKIGELDHLFPGMW
jgi:hypothetical protein